MSAASQHKHLKDMLEGPGWAILKSYLQDDILRAAMAIADNPTMTEKEIDFRRGAIHSAKQFLTAPEQILSQLETQSIFEKSKAAAQKDEKP